MFRLDTGRGVLGWLCLVLLGALACDLLPYLVMAVLAVLQIVFAFYFVFLVGYIVWMLTFGLYFSWRAECAKTS